jgi:hypothetical protein
VGFDLGVLVWAFLIVGGLVLVLRWTFKPSRPRTGRPQYGPHADLGLLTPVLSAAALTDALAARDRLSEHGIRCSLSRLNRDSYDVLVFAPDVERARQLLAG